MEKRQKTRRKTRIFDMEGGCQVYILCDLWFLKRSLARSFVMVTVGGWAIVSLLFLEVYGTIGVMFAVENM